MRKMRVPEDIKNSELRRLAFLAGQVAYLNKAEDDLAVAYEKEIEQAQKIGLDLDDAYEQIRPLLRPYPPSASYLRNWTAV
jgi:nitrate/nitrite-specific signal transduction histidine kinase